jgi:ABC-type polysaccharide/polyol phosphate transport system ATPase subunit
VDRVIENHFSVAVAAAPEILLIDEVIGVGDQVL